jgi:hypothetical protein
MLYTEASLCKANATVLRLENKGNNPYEFATHESHCDTSVEHKRSWLPLGQCAQSYASKTHMSNGFILSSAEVNIFGITLVLRSHTCSSKITYLYCILSPTCKSTCIRQRGWKPERLPLIDSDLTALRTHLKHSHHHRICL